MNWILAKEGLEPSRALHPRVFETLRPPFRHFGHSVAILVSNRYDVKPCQVLADFNMLPGKDLAKPLAVVEAQAVPIAVYHLDDIGAPRGHRVLQWKRCLRSNS